MKKSSIISFALMLVACGIAGGLIAVAIGLNDHSLIWLFDTIYNWLFSNLLVVQIVSSLLLLSCSVAIYLVCRNKQRRFPDDPVRIDTAVSPLIDIGIVVNSCLYIVMFVLYSAVVQKEENGWEVAIFVFSCFCAFFMEIQYIRLIKQIYPKRKGDPFSLKFSEQWLDSCDELEKRITYIASYRTLTALRYLLIGLFALFMLLGISIPIGIVPQLVLAVIWLFINVYNLFITRKLSQGENLE